MKKIIAVLFLMFSLFIYSGCSQVEPIAQDVCEIAGEVCNYTNLICSQIDTTKKANAEWVNDLKYKMIEIKQELKTKIEEQK